MAADLYELHTDTGIVRWANGRDEADELARDLLWREDVLSVTCEPLVVEPRERFRVHARPRRMGRGREPARCVARSIVTVSRRRTRAAMSTCGDCLRGAA